MYDRRLYGIREKRACEKGIKYSFKIGERAIDFAGARIVVATGTMATTAAFSHSISTTRGRTAT